MARNIITAIDVGSSKICTVIAAINDETSEPSVIGTAVTPSHGIKKGVVVNISEAVDAIGESLSYAEKMAGIGVSLAVVSIDGKNIFSNNTRGVIAVSGEEIAYDDVQRAIESAKTVAIPQQVRKIIHVLPREFIVDSQGGIREPVGMTGSRLEVDAHIISALTTTVHNIDKAFQQLGLRSVPVFGGLACASSVLTNTEKELGVMVLDIGYSTTDITIYQEDAIAYSGCVILGGYAVTSDLAVGLQIPSEYAEKIKLSVGKFIEESSKNSSHATRSSNVPSYLRADKEQIVENNVEDDGDKDLLDISSLQVPNLTHLSQRMYDEIVGCRLDEIFQMVADQVSLAGFSVKQPAGIVLTGGSANMQNIAKHCSRFFGVSCRIGVPQGLGGPLIDEITGPEFAVVQGLISKGIEFYSSFGGYDDMGGQSGPSIVNKIKGLFKNFVP
ncbi:MAG: cell division protein FtsA [Candidatus Dojkabacteria bacterium]